MADLDNLLNERRSKGGEERSFGSSSSSSSCKGSSSSDLAMNSPAEQQKLISSFLANKNSSSNNDSNNRCSGGGGGGGGGGTKAPSSSGGALGNPEYEAIRKRFEVKTLDEADTCKGAAGRDMVKEVDISSLPPFSSKTAAPSPPESPAGPNEDVLKKKSDLVKAEGSCEVCGYTFCNAGTRNESQKDSRRMRDLQSCIYCYGN
ncbi:uncharacterized protein LOC122259346 [Penaeus japonicus]|uniref:uncharacterized protein LOC122259346 n=1 Tax=Penaeus japonicus TaxID=27405 RepID=UPI001C70C473|nr:uncharacterized protein LOC122259346 [Penaeus japonicus]